MRYIKSLIIVFSLSFNTIHSNIFYSLVHGYFTVNRYCSALISPLYSAKNQIQYSNEIDGLADAPEIIVNFFHEKFEEHGLDPNTIRIKIKDNSFMETFGKIV